jgi:hypothetical protein
MIMLLIAVLRTEELRHVGTEMTEDRIRKRYVKLLAELRVRQQEILTDLDVLTSDVTLQQSHAQLSVVTLAGVSMSAKTTLDRLESALAGISGQK